MEIKLQLQHLFYQQVEGTQDLYSVIPYILRMEFWDQMNDIIDLDSHPNSMQERQKAYDDFIELLTDYINETDHLSMLDKVNNIISIKNNITRHFDDCPGRFIDEVLSCMEMERKIVEENNTYIDLPETVLNQDSVENGTHEFLSNNMDENGESSSTVNVEMNMTRFDTSSLNTLESVYEDYEAKWKGLQDLKIQYKECCTNKDSQPLETPKYLLEKINSLQDSIEQRQKMFDEKSRDLFDLLRELLQELKDNREKFLECQALMEVELRQDEGLNTQLMLKFERFAGILAKLHSGKMPLKPLEIFEEFLSMVVILSEQPKGVYLIDSENKKDRTVNLKTKGKRSAAKEEEQEKTYCSKPSKTISCKLLILGFKHLGPFEVKKQTVKMITEDGIDCGNIDVPGLEGIKEIHNQELVYDNIRFNGYTRQKTASHKSVTVNHQFVRLLFHLTVSCFGHDWEMKINSLPFLFGTSGCQEMELMGTRMWCFGANKGRVHEHCSIPEALKEDEVKKILDDRVKCICNNTRPLSEGDQQTLLDMIPCRDNNEPNMISLNSFVKVKPKLKRKGDSNNQTPFTYFEWFNAFVKTIQNHLLAYWNKGVIYGLVTDNEAKRKLDKMDAKISLIRFAQSIVVSPNSCNEAELNIAVNVKDKDGIASLLLPLKTIKKSGGFSEALKFIEKADKSRAVRSILMKSGKVCPLKKLGVLMVEPASKMDCTINYHSTIVSQMSYLKLLNNSPENKVSNAEEVPLRKKQKLPESLSMSPSTSCSPMNFSLSSTPNEQESPMTESQPNESDVNSPEELFHNQPRPEEPDTDRGIMDTDSPSMTATEVIYSQVETSGHSDILLSRSPEFVTQDVSLNRGVSMPDTENTDQSLKEICDQL